MDVHIVLDCAVQLALSCSLSSWTSFVWPLSVYPSLMPHYLIYMYIVNQLLRVDCYSLSRRLISFCCVLSVITPSLLVLFKEPKWTMSIALFLAFFIIIHIILIAWVVSKIFESTFQTCVWIYNIQTTKVNSSSSNFWKGMNIKRSEHYMMFSSLVPLPKIRIEIDRSARRNFLYDLMVFEERKIFVEYVECVSSFVHFWMRK